MSSLFLTSLFFLSSQFFSLEESFAKRKIINQAKNGEKIYRPSSISPATKGVMGVEIEPGIEPTNTCTSALHCCKDITNCSHIPKKGFESFLKKHSHRIYKKAGMDLKNSNSLDTPKTCFFIKGVPVSTSLHLAYTRLNTCEHIIEKAKKERETSPFSPKDCNPDLTAAEDIRKQLHQKTIHLVAKVIKSPACTKKRTQKKDKKSSKAKD